MVTSGLLYWVTRLDSFRMAFVLMIIIFIVVTGVLAIVNTIFAEDNPKKKKEIKQGFKYTFIALGTVVFFTLLLSLTPTTKEMAVIYILPKIVQSEIVEEIPKDLKLLKDLAMKKMKEYIGKEVE